MKNGIDVSYAQGLIDWTKVTGVDFVYIKCDTGVGNIDTQLYNNAKGASSAKIPFGYYHFATVDNLTNVVNDATQEANDFIKILKTLPPFNLDCVLDIEEVNILKISPKDMELWIQTYIDVMLKSGYRTIIYSYPYWLNENLSPDHKLGKYPLWIADYNIRQPLIPRGWTTWKMWQYSAKGVITGIKGNVDLSQGNF